jgi:hypothetical protein
LNPAELVTGEHSGLKALPQMAADNPNLAGALADTGVRVIASDASREQASRSIGPAVTERRWPMNIFYNVGTAAEEVDEYNWIYTSRADGGSGICDDHPDATICIAPLAAASGFTGYIVPMETRIAFDHVVSTDPAPHYAHQSNLTEDRVLYPVLDGVLARYRATFTAATPVIDAPFAAVALQQRRQATWRAACATAGVEAYVAGDRFVVVNHGAAGLDVPMTVPTGTRVVRPASDGSEIVEGPFGQPYGAERSAWKTVAADAMFRLRLPS